MIQNVSQGFEEENSELGKVKNNNIKTVIKSNFTKQNIILYVIAFIVSMVGFNNQMEGYMAPFRNCNISSNPWKWYTRRNCIYFNTNIYINRVWLRNTFKISTYNNCIFCINIYL